MPTAPSFLSSRRVFENTGPSPVTDFSYGGGIPEYFSLNQSLRIILWPRKIFFFAKFELLVCVPSSFCYHKCGSENYNSLWSSQLTTCLMVVCRDFIFSFFCRFHLCMIEIVRCPQIINKLRWLMGCDSEHIFKNKLE